MRHFLIALAFVSLTAAAQTITIRGLVVPQQTQDLAPEAVRDLSRRLAAYAVAYTPGETRIYYYDANSERSERPASGGYYRKTLGTTAAGLRVVQDYYQDSHLPQTSPLVLRADAAEDDFGEDAIDSPFARYDYTRDGAAIRITESADGINGRTAYYDRGQLVIESPLPEEADLEEDGFPAFHDYAYSHGRLYYPDGKLLLLIPLKRGGVRPISMLYRADGSLLLTQSDGTNGMSIRLWNRAGKRIPEDSADWHQAAEEVEQLREYIDGLYQRLRQHQEPTWRVRFTTP